MGSAFNPYQKWLGIPLKDQPPNHYRLLGVERFEPDPDIIERAADRQMTYLRSLQTGEHADAAQQLLNEISQARVCLLDATRKAEYDRTLQGSTQEVPLPQTAIPLGEPSSSGVGLAPPPKKRPSASDSQLGSGSAIGKGDSPGTLKTATPLGPTPSSGRAQPIPVPTSVTQQATGSVPVSAAQGSVVAQRAQRRKSSMLPLILALTVPVALGALAFVVFSIATDSTDTDRLEAVAPSTPEVGNESSGNDNSSGEDTANGSSSVGSSINRNVSSSNSGNANDDNNSSNNDETDVDDGQVAGTPASSTKVASLRMDAPFVASTIEEDNAVVSDRNITFSSVASELQGLQFTRWRFGPVASFSFDVLAPGRLYMILPPQQYSRALPAMEIEGWTKTDLQCTIRTEVGIEHDCQVYVTENVSKSAKVGSSPAVWPILAATKIEHKTRILADIVDGPDDPPSEVDPGATAGVPGNNPPGDDDDNTVAAVVVGEDDGNPVAATKKLAVPTSNAQQPIRARITEVFELDTLQTLDEKIAAAKKMYEVGRDSSDNPTERFVMLATAARLAAESGDLVTSLRAVETIDEHYQSKTAAMQLYLVRQFANARIPKHLKENQLRFVVPVLDQGLNQDQFESVDQTVTELFENGLSHKELGNRRRIARDMKAKYRVVANAKQTLRTKPDDGAANTIVGEYLCFQKLDWDAGLPLLAKSDQEDLRELAQADLDKATEANIQIKVGDGWYDLAQEQESELAQGGLLTRAEDWYRKAKAQVSGLDAAHVSKRLDEIQADLEELGWISPDISYVDLEGG